MKKRDALDLQHLSALTAQLARTGVETIEIGYLNDDPPYRFWASGNWKGQRVFTEDHAGGDLAVFALARQVIHGGLCTSCEREISFPHLRGGYCGRVLIGDGEAMAYRPLCDIILLAAAVNAGLEL